MEQSTSLLGILPIVGLMGGVGVGASVGGVLALRRSRETVICVLGGVGIVSRVLFVLFALVVLFAAAERVT